MIRQSVKLGTNAVIHHKKQKQNKTKLDAVSKISAAQIEDDVDIV